MHSDAKDMWGLIIVAVAVCSAGMWWGIAAATKGPEPAKCLLPITCPFQQEGWHLQLLGEDYHCVGGRWRVMLNE